MKKVVVVAPHPDDETLGCGGALLRHLSCGDEIHWIIVTEACSKAGYSKQSQQTLQNQIKHVSKAYPFHSVRQLQFPTTYLDQVPIRTLVQSLSRVLGQIRPETVYAPNQSDIHSDHRIVSQATQSCLKWFRLPFIQKALFYEVLSETNFMSHPRDHFHPNIYVNITEQLQKKIEIFMHYETETQTFPSPRSVQTIRALAQLRGSESGFHAAEAFMLFTELIV